MEVRAVIAAALMFFCAASARGEMVTWRVRATVGPILGDTELPFDVRQGDLLSVFFTFDDAAPIDEVASAPYSPFIAFYNNIYGASIFINGQHVDTIDPGSISGRTLVSNDRPFVNGQYGDEYIMEIQDERSGLLVQWAMWDTYDGPNQGPLTSTSLLRTPLPRFSFLNQTLRLFPSHGAEVVGFFPVASVVPLPPAAITFISGLLALGLFGASSGRPAGIDSGQLLRR